MKWRLIIEDIPRDAYENMALDYSLLYLSEKPTLRLYKWNPPAVTIGRFQNINEEINLNFCIKNKINFTRRITGGGAVFHDKEITYSIVIPEKNNFFSKDLKKSYLSICNSIILGLAEFGLKASFSGINDIIVNGKKISGCAQTRKNNKILHHGTLLLDINKRIMFNALKVNNNKISDKSIVLPEQRVTSLLNELGYEPLEKDVIDKILFGFSKNFGIDFFKDSFSNKELSFMEKIKKQIFENEKWIYERSD